MKNLLKILIWLLMLVIASGAATWHVPTNFETIQEAINASADGDVVIVAEGRYYENINFMGKAITVASQFYLDKNKVHINRTIIDGSKPQHPNVGSVVSFTSGEDTNSVLCGFTITGGTGTFYKLSGFPPMRLGGGISCFASGAKIIHNIVVGNSLTDAPFTMGAGFNSGPPFIPAFVILENNIFRRNSCVGVSRVVGGGAELASSGRVLNNVFEDNRLIAMSIGPAGAGFAAESWDPSEAPRNEIFVSGNKIINNKALQAENADFWLGGIGAGIWVYGSMGTITNNIIMNNEVRGVQNTYGAGVLLDFPSDDLIFKNNIVSGNYFSGQGSCYGGGLAIWDGNSPLENNIFMNNKGSYGGGVWLGYNFCFSRLINNTFTSNHADIQGGAINTFNSHPVLMNSILWGNTAPVDPELCLESGEIDVSYCNIAGGWAGDGNMELDPMTHPKLCLLPPISPCVDAGNPDPAYYDPESAFLKGMAMRPARGTIRNDMGAYGGPNAADWLNFFNFIQDMQRAEWDEHTVLTTAKPSNVLLDHYPNPFNIETVIKFVIPRKGHVSLKIYNILGQEVADLVSGKLTGGEHRYHWNADGAASGLYFSVMTYEGKIYQQRLILMK